MKKAGLSSILIAVVLLAVEVIAEAQQTGKVPRIGYVAANEDPNIPGSNVEAFRQGLRDLGYTEGKNILVEYRYAEGQLDRVPSLVAELVQLKVDVLVSGNFATIRAAKQATKTIPIVIVTAQDPVTAGLVDSLARPGGNITAHQTHPRVKRQTAGIAQGDSSEDISGRGHLGYERTGAGYCF